MNDIINELLEISNDNNAIFNDRKGIISFYNSIKKLLFTGYFERIDGNLRDYLCLKANEATLTLRKELNILFLNDENKVDAIVYDFFKGLKEIKLKLIKDYEAIFKGDPASTSYEEIITSYPGMQAIIAHRIANLLYRLEVPLIPRIISEYAHSKTGIDIHPGAIIGESFFIDHGTGIVIGETTVIGDNVKIYQGVTLGAISLSKGKSLKGTKRHPTIKNNVTIYSGASILGGKTIIGNNVTIGSNVFITKSVEDNVMVILKEPEKIIKISTNLK